MSTPIRVRAVLHGPKGEGRIWGEWRHFDCLSSAGAIEAVRGFTRAGEFVEVSRSNHWDEIGHQRITFSTPDGINHVTVHVISTTHGHDAACACVECLLALL